MSKRTIYTTNYGDGEFIRVENKKSTPKGNCPSYPLIEDEINRLQGMLPPEVPSKIDEGGNPITKPDVFNCPSYYQLLRKLIELRIKLWYMQLAQYRKGGSNYTPGRTLPPDLANLYANIIRAIAKFSKDTNIPIDRKIRF